jgi:hypothetical protein
MADGTPKWWYLFMTYFGLAIVGWTLRPVLYAVGMPAYGGAMVLFTGLMVVLMLASPIVSGGHM